MVAYRHVSGPTRHPEGRCPKCGGRAYEFPRGLDVNGTTVYTSCGQCDYAARDETETAPDSASGPATKGTLGWTDGGHDE